MASESLAVKYRPKTWNDVVEQYTIKQILNEQIRTNQVKRVLLFTGPAGCGKAQPLDSKVLTPDGYVRMKEVKLDQFILDGNGDPCNVTGIYPQGVRDCYKIVFSDNTFIKVSDEHINSIFRYNEVTKKKEYLNITTTKLLKIFNKNELFLVPVPILDCWSDENCTIDSYLLGILLSCGSISAHNLIIRCVDENILKKVRQKLAEINCIIVNNSGNKKDWSIIKNQNIKDDSIASLRQVLKDLNLQVASNKKFIPRQYLYSSYSTRVNLLQGLMDGAGVNRTFTTTSKNLSEDFEFLVRSLGVVDVVTYKERTARTQEKFLHFLKVPAGLSLYQNKKVVLPKNKEEFPLRKILRIEKIGKEECQCIMVNSPLHTYITDNVTPTHNTTNARIFASELEPVKSNIIELNCADKNGVDDIRAIIIENAKVKPLQGKYKIFILDESHMLTVQAQNALLKLLEEPPVYCIFIMCTTDPQKVLSTILSRSYRYDFQKISMKGIVDRLNYILNSEKESEEIQSWNQDAINYIARQSNGGLRDAITLLDKCLSYTKNLTINDVVSVLGVTNYDIQFDILDCLIRKDEVRLIERLTELYQSGKDLKLFTKNFLSFVLDVNKYISIRNFEYINIPSTYEQQINVYNTSHKPYLKHLITELIKLNSEIKWETSPRTLLESSLLLEVV